RMLYALGGNSNVVVPIDLTTRTALPPILVPAAPSAIAITPDGKTIWVDSVNNTLTPIDVATDTAGQTITSPLLSRPTGLTITPDGKTMIVADQNAIGNANVAVLFDLATRTFGAPIPVPVGQAFASGISDSQAVADVGLDGSATPA